MLKSQILAGGRGKGTFDTDGKGGVRLVSTYVLRYPAHARAPQANSIAIGQRKRLPARPTCSATTS